MSRTVVVEVTAEDIEVAVRGHDYELACFCPVARAVHRALAIANHRSIGVYRYGDGDETYFGIGSGADACDARLPGEADEFVREFDSRRPVKPLTFTLVLP